MNKVAHSAQHFQNLILSPLAMFAIVANTVEMFCLKSYSGVGVTVQWLKALAALPRIQV